MSENNLPVSGKDDQPNNSGIVMDRPVSDPGIEEHIPRHSDTDKAAGDFAARQVITCFALAPVFALAFIVVYFAVPKAWTIDLGTVFHANAQHTLLGLTLGIAIMLIGVGTVQWAREIMVDTEISEERHPAASSEEDRREVLEVFDKGAAES
ncbi:MAG: ubiquinol-cytochrome C reductase, partial [Propionibacteriales bacterium]|nr:ubiquinol-cytochrome C reductase [Propionibacteriales bacterium]